MGSDDTLGEETPALEWALAGLGAVVVLATLGYLLFVGLFVPDTAPSLGTRVEDVTAGPDGSHRVRVRVVNRGGKAVAAVVLQGRLSEGGREVERARVSIDYVPARSSRSATLVFGHDPSRYRLDVAPVGYREP